jgi:predicted GTPase
MKVSDLESYLIKLYKAGSFNSRVSVLLLGAPGIGKSYTCYSVAKRLAKDLGKEFIDYSDEQAPKILAEPERYFVFCDFRLTECEPSDLLGIPKAREKPPLRG